MPTPTASLMWSGRTPSEQANGANFDYALTRRYLVRDAATEAEALAAAGLPLYNDPLNPGSPLRVRGRSADPKDGPTTWIVTIEFAIPTVGEFPTGETDPIRQPEVVTWGLGTKQLPMEQDVTKRLVRMSTGTFVDPLPTRDVEIETLTISRIEPYYDRAKARKYRGRYNSNPFLVGDTMLLPGECLCRSILPAESYAVNASRIRINYTFDIDVDSRAIEDQSGRPFDSHIVDQDVRGFYQESGGQPTLGWLCTVDKDGKYSATIDRPVLLDGKGKPIDTKLRVTESPDGTGRVFAPVANPDTSCHLTPDAASPFDTAATRQWLYRNHLEADFSNILSR